VSATQEKDHPVALDGVIGAKTRAEEKTQLEQATAKVFMVAEIAELDMYQTG